MDIKIQQINNKVTHEKPHAYYQESMQIKTNKHQMHKQFLGQQSCLRLK